MRGDRGGVEVEDHPLRRRARPRALARAGARLTDRIELLLADREHHAPRRRDRGDIAEQRRLARQRLKV
jgi:hypothetical protein